MTDGGVYFHGLPGTPDEFAAVCGARDGWDAADLLAANPADPMADILATFDARVDQFGPQHLEAFSLGAMVALHIAAARPRQVRTLRLMSPAAPLSLGRFLPEMAGAQVFRVARSANRLRALLAMQAVAVRLAPGLVQRLMFSTASPGERVLAATDPARKLIREGLRRALIKRRQTYAAWLRLYVSDWSDILGDVTGPVTLVQGMEDAWTPPAMATALARALPHATLKERAGLGHYGVLVRKPTP